jgi:hypothetical protein
LINHKLLRQEYDLWKQGQLSDRQMAISFFLIVHSLKYDLKKRQEVLLHRLSEREDLLSSWQFKKVKGKALESLRSWGLGRYHFVLMDSMPTTREVLSFQAQGQRPVSLLIENLFEPKRHKEDAFEFFCHDLEHGAMFFQDFDLFCFQKDFFFKVQQSLSTDLWESYFSEEGFLERWAYWVSDMNTHPEHYKAYLHAIIDKSDHHKFQFLFES